MQLKANGILVVDEACNVFLIEVAAVHVHSLSVGPLSMESMKALVVVYAAAGVGAAGAAGAGGGGGGGGGAAAGGGTLGGGGPAAAGAAPAAVRAWASILPKFSFTL